MLICPSPFSLICLAWIWISPPAPDLFDEAKIPLGYLSLLVVPVIHSVSVAVKVSLPALPIPKVLMLICPPLSSTTCLAWIWISPPAPVASRSTLTPIALELPSRCSPVISSLSVAIKVILAP